MKRFLWTSLLTVALNLSARGGLYTFSYDSAFENDGTIPDGNASGWSDSRTISGLSGVIQNVTLSLNVSGGADGDLYAYLSFNNGSVVLLNRIGTTSTDPFGSSAPGFTSFQFDDSTPLTDIHNSLGTPDNPISGIFNTDRRTADPLLVDDTSPRGPSLDLFDDESPDGCWTLFFADVNGGNDPSTVVNWTLEISTVPEPSSLALGLLGGVFVILARKRRAQARLHG